MRVRRRLMPPLWLCLLSWSCVGEPDRTLADPTDLVCRVVDASTGQAIPGARVRLDFPTGNAASNLYQTDASGECRIKPASAATAGPPLWFLADGYAAKKIEWDEIEPLVASNSFSVKLESGSSGGGLIMDERGQPLPNAQVFVQSALEGGRVFSPDDFHFEETGMDGRWTCRHLPGQLKDTTLRVLHSGFAERLGKTTRGGRRNSGLPKPVTIVSARKELTFLCSATTGRFEPITCRLALTD